MKTLIYSTIGSLNLRMPQCVCTQIGYLYSTRKNMTTITLEVPDELAGRLAALQTHLPQLLTFALDLLGTPSNRPSLLNVNSPVLTEIIDFLARGPSSTDLLAYKVSPNAQMRLEELLDTKREQGLTPQEAAELDTYQQVNHLLILLKARARIALTSSN